MKESTFQHDIYFVNQPLQFKAADDSIEFLPTDPEARVPFPALADFLKKEIKRKQVLCLERGPLSLVSTTEELLDKNLAAPV
jgi:hypothetical protein